MFAPVGEDYSTLQTIHDTGGVVPDHWAGIIALKPGVKCGNWKQDDLIGYRDDRGLVLNRRCLRKTCGTHLAAGWNCASKWVPVCASNRVPPWVKE